MLILYTFNPPISSHLVDPDRVQARWSGSL